MIWLVIIVAVVVLVCVGALVFGGPATPRDAAYFRAAVELHGIRRRQEVAQFKSEVRRDVAQARRELRQEISDLNGR